ncbi:MAG: hypothetical protein ACJ75Q_04095 [Gaiellaceae bacterium]
MPNRREVVLEQLDDLRTDVEALWVALTRDPKKEARKERAWTIFAGVLGAAAAIGARQLATRAWNVLTGETPPVPQAGPPQRKRA